MSRHAYLIMAHNEFNLLKKLITLLDDPRNDIYVHVDKKAKDFDPGQFQNLTQYADLFFVERTRVSWGAYSQINAELVLLKAAAKNFYKYYHLLSGSDLPIKSQDDFHQFFKLHDGCQFLDFDINAYQTKNFIKRFRYYYFFQEMLGKNRKGFVFFLNKALLKFQKDIGFSRIKKAKIDFNKGLNWFSITHPLANFLLSQENFIRHTFKHSLACDEVFIHTIVWNSEFRSQICNEHIRITKKGRPYIFRQDDFDLLMNSSAFIARKFSESVDPSIVEKIYKLLKETKPNLP